MGSLIYTIIQINSKLGSSVKETDFQLFSRILKLKWFGFSTQTAPCHCYSFPLNRISIRNKKTHSVITIFPPNLSVYTKDRKVEGTPIFNTSLAPLVYLFSFSKTANSLQYTVNSHVCVAHENDKMQQYIAIDASKLSRGPKARG